MEYFVSINNTAFDRWQVELLIESFKINKIQDYLCVAIAGNTGPQYADYTKNLKKHKRTVSHEDFGDKNSLFSLILAIDNNLIRQPFVLLKPHTMLVKPVEEGPDTIIYNVQGDISPEIQDQLKDFPLPFPGDVFIFKNCPNRFFHKIAIKMGEGITEEIAWLTTMQEYRDFVTYGTGPLEMPMIYPVMETPIINYKHGYPGKFQRIHYRFERAIQFGGDPHKDILQIDPTPLPTEYMQEVVKSYQKAKS